MCPSKFQGFFFSILVFCNYHDKVFRIFIDLFCLCLADGYLLLNCAQSEHGLFSKSLVCFFWWVLQFSQQLEIWHQVKPSTSHQIIVFSFHCYNYCINPNVWNWNWLTHPNQFVWTAPHLKSDPRHFSQYTLSVNPVHCKSNSNSKKRTLWIR